MYDGKTATICTFHVHCITIQSLFVAEISDSEFILLDTKVYKSESFNRESTLDTQTQIIKRRRPSNTWIFIRVRQKEKDYWEEKHNASYEKTHVPRLIKTYIVSKYAKRTENTEVKSWRNISLNLISSGETGHSKTYLG